LNLVETYGVTTAIHWLFSIT